MCWAWDVLRFVSSVQIFHVLMDGTMRETKRIVLRFLLCAGLILAASCGGDDNSSKGNNGAGDAGDVISHDDVSAPDVVEDTRAPGDTDTTCVPSCDLIACGADDGCGGVCGCANGEGCVDGTCQAAGEACGAPIALEDNGDDTWTGQGNLATRVDTLSGYASGLGCEVIGDSAAGDQADEFFKFTAPADASYDVVLTAHDDEADVFFALFDGAECKAGKCLALVNNSGSTHTTAETFELQAGKTYTIAVEAKSAAGAGSFSLQVTRQACVPSCASGACGMDDGCGNICGCQPGEECDAGVCTAPTGESCADALHLVQTGNLWSGTGDLSGAVHSLTAEGCEELGNFGSPNTDETPNQVWRFTTDEAGRYTVTLRPQTAGDLLFYVFSDPVCDGSVCLGMVERTTSTETQPFDALEANHTYYVVVEPYSTRSGDLGTYTLEVERYCEAQCTAGACGMDNGCGGICGCGAGEECDLASNTCEALPGTSCAAPLELTQNGDSWSGTSDLNDGGRGLSATGCESLGSTSTPGSSGVTQQVWSFKTTEAGGHIISLTPDTAGDLLFYVFEELGCSADACLGFVDSNGRGAAETHTFRQLQADHTYYIVVESWFSGDSHLGTYTLEVEKACDPQCAAGACGVADGCGGTCGCGIGEACEQPDTTQPGTCEIAPGDSCALPAELTQAGRFWSGQGDLGNATDAHDRGACTALGSSIYSPTGEGLPDQAWRFTTEEEGSYKITVTGGSIGDFFFYLYDDASCGDSACLGYQEAGYSSETQTFELDAAHTYYLVVDMYSASGTPGTYSVEVEKLCTPRCVAGECGMEDGCGGTCGCAGGLTCDTATSQCVTAPGQTCDEPLWLSRDADTWSGDGDLSDGAITLSPAGCTKLSTRTYDYGDDDTINQVWAFTTDEAGQYTITVEPDTTGDILFYVFDDVSCASDVCLGYMEGSSYDETYTFDNLEANRTYYIVVELYFDFGTTGTYGVEVTYDGPTP